MTTLSKARRGMTVADPATAACSMSPQWATVAVAVAVNVTYVLSVSVNGSMA